ncbi:MAG: flagellar basal body P-ring formation chaperone FlgA [Candidatus Hydrogenedentota bacterium]
MRFKLCAVLLLIFISFQLDAVTIKLKDSVVVRDDNIYLSDICESINDKNLLICESPAPGTKRIIPSRLVEIRLKQAHLRDIKFEDSDRCEVYRSADIVSDEMIKDNILEFLNKNRPEGVFNPEYRFIKLPGKVYVKEGKIRLEVQAKNRKINFYGSNFLEVKVYVDDEIQKNINICVDIESMVEVAVAAREIPRGKIISEEDIFLTLKRYKEIPKDAYDKLELLIAKRVRHFIDKDICLTPRDVEIPPVVKRGDEVTLISKIGNIVISVKGEAREDARLGDKIWVKNIQSGKMVQGVVTDCNRVSVGGNL